MFARRVLMFSGLVSFPSLGLGYLKLTNNKDQRHIVLDLDHTLLHSIKLDQKYNKYGQFHNMIDQQADFEVLDKYAVHLRRWCIPFIKLMNTIATVHCFTAATEDYALQILDNIDPQREIFQIIKTRKHLQDIENDIIGKRRYTKNLNHIINAIQQDDDLDDDTKTKKKISDLKRILLIDDKRRSFVVNQHENQEINGIQVKPFNVNIGQDHILLKCAAIIIYRIMNNQHDLTNNNHKNNTRTIIT